MKYPDRQKRARPLSKVGRILINAYPLHAHPGPLWHVLLAAIQLSPHALPVVHTLQHACGGGGFVGCTTIGAGVSVGGKNIVGIDVGRSVRVGASVRVGPKVLVGASVRVGPRVHVGAFVKNCAAVALTVRVSVGVAVRVAVKVNVGGIGVKVGSSVAIEVGSFVALGNSIVMLIFLGASGVHVGGCGVPEPTHPTITAMAIASKMGRFI